MQKTSTTVHILCISSTINLLKAAIVEVKVPHHSFTHLSTEHILCSQPWVRMGTIEMTRTPLREVASWTHPHTMIYRALSRFPTWLKARELAKKHRAQPSCRSWTSSQNTMQGHVSLWCLFFLTSMCFAPGVCRNLKRGSQCSPRTECVCSKAKEGVLESWQGTGFKGPWT